MALWYWYFSDRQLYKTIFTMCTSTSKNCANQIFNFHLCFLIAGYRISSIACADVHQSFQSSSLLMICKTVVLSGNLLTDSTSFASCIWRKQNCMIISCIVISNSQHWFLSRHARCIQMLEWVSQWLHVHHQCLIDIQFRAMNQR